MTYVKKGAMIFLVDDDKVPKYTNDGFEVYVPESIKPAKGKAKNAAEKKAAQEVAEESEAEAGEGETDAENTD
ncbi:hypothetical protein [Hydrogenoanaerobacterium sp.]|uniref:hypothetical protein n=1 Tax=Hydrogenoanaerobacterium sp. TaxID=2953763 RepID=UPI0028987E43|nr:hypothetical protein [Hydrogenoanaerobacterium sp.]